MAIKQKNITREEKRKQKLDVILRNAANAFLERGYYKTSLDDIARMQNVTKPTLYYYIENKEDILVKCEQETCGNINAMLDEVMARKISGFDMLYAFISEYIIIITGEVARCHVRHRGQMENENLKARSIQIHKDIEQRVRKIIERGIGDKSIRDCNAKILAILLFDSLNGISAWYRPEGEINQHELVEEVLMLVSSGVVGD